MKLLTVPVDKLKFFYPICKPMLERNTYNVEILEANLVSELERLAVFIDDGEVVACATYHEITPEELRLRLGACPVGKSVDYVECVRMLEDMARQRYKRISLQGRKGWGKVLPDYSFKMTVIGKEL